MTGRRARDTRAQGRTWRADRPSQRLSAARPGYRVRAQIPEYRRLGFGLREIADLVDDPDTDVVAHLRRLRGLLLEQRDRADAMIAGIDSELQARAKGRTMTPEEHLGILGARLYDAIGGAYPATRRTDPRIAAQVWAALGDARTVLNVGAGTGSYEPPRGHRRRAVSGHAGAAPQGCRAVRGRRRGEPSVR